MKNNLIPTAKKLNYYADDTTLHSKALKLDITVLENTGCNRLISIPDNGMQHAAVKAIEWSQSNKQHLYASKTRYIIMFSLNNKLHNTISIDRWGVYCKNRDSEAARSHKVYAPEIYLTHWHSNREKQSSSACLLTLKRKGVPPSVLTKYYQACIFPISSYASPVWHSHLNQNRRDKLEGHQPLIHPTIPSSTSNNLKEVATIPGYVTYALTAPAQWSAKPCLPSALKDVLYFNF